MKIDRPIRALGAMSGTSLDGVDAAVLITDGETITGFGETAYHAYSPAEQKTIRAAFGNWTPDPSAAEAVETAHAKLLSQFSDIDLIGFHGQTVAHNPANQRTLQIGDGQILAEILQAPVIWDFRSADVKLGGQGAPLAPFYHFALAKWMNATAPMAFLNLGGVGNLTWIDPTKAKPEDAGALLAFDTGPANALLNDLMTTRLNQSHDANGALAAQGTVHDQIVTDFLTHPYFFKMPPKSLDRDDFVPLQSAVANLSTADAAATLTAATALSVSEAMRHCPQPPTTLWVAGGGRHNSTMMQMIAASVSCPVKPVEDADLDGDMLEAQAFAYLAVRVARGLPTSCPGTTGVKASVCGGTLSTPSHLTQRIK